MIVHVVIVVIQRSFLLVCTFIAHCQICLGGKASPSLRCNGYFPGALGKPVPECLHSGFSWSKDDGGAGNNWNYKTCKAPVSANKPTFSFYRSFLSSSQQCQCTEWKSEKASGLWKFCFNNPQRFICVGPCVMDIWWLDKSQVMTKPSEMEMEMGGSWLSDVFPFSALTLLVGQQEWHPACKKLDVGLLVTIWLELSMSYSYSCHYHHLRHP